MFGLPCLHHDFGRLGAQVRVVSVIFERQLIVIGPRAFRREWMVLEIDFNEGGLPLDPAASDLQVVPRVGGHFLLRLPLCFHNFLPL